MRETPSALRFECMAHIRTTMEMAWDRSPRMRKMLKLKAIAGVRLGNPLAERALPVNRSACGVSSKKPD